MTQPTSSNPPNPAAMNLGDEDPGYIPVHINGKDFDICPLEVIDDISKLTPNPDDQSGARFCRIVATYLKNKFEVDVSPTKAWIFYQKTVAANKAAEDFFTERLGSLIISEETGEDSAEPNSSDSTEPSNE